VRTRAGYFIYKIRFTACLFLRRVWSLIRRSAELITATFTVVLAAATAALVIAAIVQHIDTVEAIKATNRLATAAEDYAGEAKNLARAARRSVEIAEGGQRAWIAPTGVIFAVPFAETEGIVIRVFYRNSGQQPALGVIFNANTYALDAVRAGRDESQPTALVASDAKLLVPNTACDDSAVTAQGNVVYPSATASDFADFPLSPDKTRPGLKADVAAGRRILYFNGCFSYIAGGQIRRSALCEYLFIGPKGQMDFRVCPAGNLAD
jgi:hypothetical protein